MMTDHPQHNTHQHTAPTDNMEVEAEATGGQVGDQEFSPELLRFFYGACVCVWARWVDETTRAAAERSPPHPHPSTTTARLFPYTQMFKWLSYGNGA